MRGKAIGALAMLCVPALASGYTGDSGYLGYPTTDDIPWPADGRFPAYPAEPTERPVLFWVSGGAYYDSNVFRLSDNVSPQTVLGTPHKSDTIGRLGLGLKADLPVERQRIKLEAALDAFWYDRFSFLDNTAYRLAGAWLWQAGNQWSGDLGAWRRHYLQPLAYINAPIKNMITEDRAYGSAAYLLTPRWRLRGAADWVQWDNGNALQAANDATTVSGTGGVDYVTPGGSYVGGQVRYSDGRYPNPQFVAPGVFVSNDYDEIEGSAVARWIVTGLSTLDLRVGYTSRSYDQVPQRDFSGFTGRLGWDWIPGGKTLVNLAAWREIQSSPDINTAYVLSHGVSIGPRWAPTVKIVLDAKVFYVVQDYEGDPGLAIQSGPEREDKTTGARLALGWHPVRYLALMLAGEWANRSSNLPLREYDYYVISGNIRLSF
jgi:exopolysaccharide biosynthesis operon protein EpsL